MQFLRDESCIVLDFLPRGHAIGRPEPIAQVLGDKYFSLLEVIIRREVTVKSGDKVYIGEGKRDHVDHVKRRIITRELTTFARSELPFVVEKIVKENEKKFVDFFNTAQPLSTRIHQLELLPGVGKKHMWDIIEERKKGPFTSFEDLKHRIKLLPDPSNAVIKRVLQELENENERYHLFVSVPPKRF